MLYKGIYFSAQKFTPSPPFFAENIYFTRNKKLLAIFKVKCTSHLRCSFDPIAFSSLTFIGSYISSIWGYLVALRSPKSFTRFVFGLQYNTKLVADFPYTANVIRNSKKHFSLKNRGFN